jgi:hypothetical protein
MDIKKYVPGGVVLCSGAPGLVFSQSKPEPVKRTMLQRADVPVPGRHGWGKGKPIHRSRELSPQTHRRVSMN